MRAGAGMALALLLCGCVTTSVKPAPPTPIAGSSVAPLPGLTPSQRVEEAIARLRQGKADQARVELKAALAVDPANHRAHNLLTQLDADPKLLLGEPHFAYKVRPGETLWSLAQRFLGDPLQFYALARYNGVTAPEGVGAGQILQIPGAAPKPVAVAPRRRTSRPAVASAPVVQARASDPAQASRLRRTALEHMNRGQINQAEVLLQQARGLDPDSPVIQADLDRARRIQASLRP